MYTPTHFAETRVEVLHDHVRRHPLATLVTQTAAGELVADHIPMLLCDGPGPFGTLQGHVARANPVWSRARTDIESLAIFHGPAAYVSPSWYATKAETGRVVPTWDYAVVHAHGVLRPIDDPAWLRSLVERLTNANEAGFPAPWQVSDAPADYVEKQLRAIVGIELVVTRLAGKWKMSQNQPDANRAGAIRGLRQLGTEEAAAVADLIPPPINS
jgi:transcriptional regulator